MNEQNYEISGYDVSMDLGRGDEEEEEAKLPEGYDESFENGAIGEHDIKGGHLGLPDHSMDVSDNLHRLVREQLGGLGGSNDLPILFGCCFHVRRENWLKVVLGIKIIDVLLAKFAKDQLVMETLLGISTVFIILLLFSMTKVFWNRLCHYFITIIFFCDIGLFTYCYYKVSIDYDMSEKIGMQIGVVAIWVIWFLMNFSWFIQLIKNKSFFIPKNVPPKEKPSGSVFNQDDSFAEESPRDNNMSIEGETSEKRRHRKKLKRRKKKNTIE